MGWGLWALGEQVAELREAGIDVGVVGGVFEQKAGCEGATGGRGEEGSDCRHEGPLGGVPESHSQLPLTSCRATWL